MLSPGRRGREPHVRPADAGVRRAGLKSLLVELDEGSTAKGLAAADPLALLDELAKTMSRKEVERQRPAKIVALREGGLDFDAQKEIVKAFETKVAALQRDRQGTSKPTDG